MGKKTQLKPLEINVTCKTEIEHIIILTLIVYSQSYFRKEKYNLTPKKLLKISTKVNAQITELLSKKGGNEKK